MADKKFPTILVRWEGNNSKRYDNTKEEILVSNIVAINKTAVIEPSLDQISVGDHIEYEFVAKKGKVQLWRGVVVSTDPDAERRTGSVPNDPETTSKRARCRRTTTKEASHQNATDSDTAERRTATTSLFENLSSTKGKRQKRHSSSPYQVQDQSGNVVGVLLFVLVFNSLVPVMAQTGPTKSVWPCFTPRCIIFCYTANKFILAYLSPYVTFKILLERFCRSVGTRWIVEQSLVRKCI